MCRGDPRRLSGWRWARRLRYPSRNPFPWDLRDAHESPLPSNVCRRRSDRGSRTGYGPCPRFRRLAIDASQRPQSRRHPFGATEIRLRRRSHPRFTLAPVDDLLRVHAGRTVHPAAGPGAARLCAADTRRQRRHAYRDFGRTDSDVRAALLHARVHGPRRARFVARRRD